MLIPKKYLPVFTLLFLLICSLSFNAYAGFDLDKGIQRAFHDNWYYLLFALLIGIPSIEYLKKDKVTAISGTLMFLSTSYILYARFL